MWRKATRRLTSHTQAVLSTLPLSTCTALQGCQDTHVTQELWLDRVDFMTCPSLVRGSHNRSSLSVCAVTSRPADGLWSMAVGTWGHVKHRNKAG